MSTSIATLNVNDGRWRLKARVSSISNRRSWANERSEGSLFSVVLADAEGSTIRGTFFREAVDKFYDQMQVGNVYTFSGGRLKKSKPQYNTCQSQLEIIFDVHSDIRLDHPIASNSPKGRRSSSHAGATASTPLKAARRSSINLTPEAFKTEAARPVSSNKHPGTVMNRGVWGKESTKNTEGTLTPVGKSSNTTTEVTPVFDPKLNETDRQKLRADRAAAAEARLKQNPMSRGSNNKKRSRSKSPVRSSTPVRSSSPMRWTLK
jgi:hypothetical protein